MATPRKAISEMRTRMLTLCLTLALTVAVSGCDRTDANRSVISGEVTLDGTPVGQGAILFIPMDGTKGAATGGQIENGHYRIAGKQGAAIGWNRVEIRAMRKTGKMVPKGLGATGEMVEEQAEAAPPKYNSASTLKTEVKVGDNTASFELTTR